MPLILTGPTASGKSSLALSICKALPGDIINADAIQLYRDLPILTARPSPEDEAQTPHHLYGILGPESRANAFEWAEKAEKIIRKSLSAQRLPIICGGSGFYLQTLTEGLAPIPDIPEETRTQVRRLAQENKASLKKALSPEDATLIDPQRMARAVEVFRATGKSLSWWKQQKPTKPALPPALRILVLPAREQIYRQCDNRFNRMIEKGAVQEVKNFLAENPGGPFPVMKAVGARELGQWLTGDLSFEKACEEAQRHTRHYAKRQMTWMRHRFQEDILVTDPIHQNEIARIICEINAFQKR